MVSADRICGFHGLRRGLFFVCRIRDMPVGVLSLEKEPLLLRVAALTRHLPGQPRRVEPTEAIKAGLLLTRRAVIVTSAVEVGIDRVKGVGDVTQRGGARALPGEPAVRQIQQSL